ncbi:MAG: peptide deformylase [Patescibacteria group bacterium]
MRISSGFTKIGKEIGRFKEKKPDSGIHGPVHALAKEISETFGEPKKFPMYLGIIKNIGLKRAYEIFSKIRQSKSIKDPGKLFVYESRYKMEIVKKPAEILTKKLADVDLITAQLKKVILKMKKIMRENKGIGLAANQIGLNMKLFVIDEELAKEYNAPDVYINPEIKPYPPAGRAGSKDTEEMEEGCLSIPETWLKIKRSKKVKVKTVDEEGKKHKFIAKGMLARVLQHEYDHLQGVLITDK